MRKLGFDTGKYIRAQKDKILERVGRFERLYLEFGGKLCYDLHAARVLPGYEPTTKIELLKQLGDISIIYCVSARDLEKKRVRRDFGLTYDNQTLKAMADIKDFGLHADFVVITRYSGEHSARVLKKRLENFGVEVVMHNEIEGYPTDQDKVLRGYDGQPYIPVDKKINIVSGVGGGSGKMATCLCQIYKERKEEHNTAFAKFETFPVWNLPLDHPVNVAYEAATADLGDVNMLDPFHKQAYDIDAVNYNRDIENYGILQVLLQRITGEQYPFGYRSPTDMGVNMAGFAITDDDVCREAAKQEIIRRHFAYLRGTVEGVEPAETMDQMRKIMRKVGVRPGDRKVVGAARRAAKKAKGFSGVQCGAAIEIGRGKIITGKNSSLLHAESAAILNAVKELAGIPDERHLISEDVVVNISGMKKGLMDKKACCLNVDETMIALSVCSMKNPDAKKAMAELGSLEGCQMHITHLPKQGDEAGLFCLKMQVTTDAKVSLLKNFQ